MKEIYEFGKLIRIKHYLKNIIIFFPIFFSGNLFSYNYFLTTLAAFICFSFVSSAVYIINDIKDKNSDKKHPVKCFRPIASGEISVKQAIVYLFSLLLMSILIMFIVNMSLVSIGYLLIYFSINILYSFYLKNVPIIDIAIVVAGFVIRLLFGASLFDVEVSNWLYLTILSVAFYLALGKRRGEDASYNTRKVLKFYNKDFLDKNMYMFLAISIVFYSLWATDPVMVEKSDNLLIWTVPLMILICMKYSLDIEKSGDGDPISTIFNDKVLIMISIVFLIIHLFIIYF